MGKRVYISADYDFNSGDRNVVEELNKWGQDDKHKVDFVDMAKVVSGSVSEDSDCRPCDLKLEFNRQINASSYVIFVIGDKTATRTSGSGCVKSGNYLAIPTCTPYKQNTNGKKYCKHFYSRAAGDDFCEINGFSYLRHEFEQAKKRGKNIIVVYNSTRCESSWLPSYMSDYKDKAVPFWITGILGNRIGNYLFIKKALGYDD